MGRTSYALMSLIAAVPAAVLVLILVMGFLQHANTMPGLLPVVAGFTLLAAAAVAVTPVGLLLFGGSKPAKAGGAATDAPAKAEGSGATLEAGDESFVTDEPADDALDDASADDWNEGDSEVDFGESDFGESDFGEAEGDEFEFDDSSSGEIDADLDFDDDAKR